METIVPHYFSKAEEDGIIFCFRGPMSQRLVETLEYTLKLQIEQEDKDVNKTCKVFSIFVEQVQNVIRYSEERTLPQEVGEPGAGAGIILIGRKEGQFFISCGNLVKNDNVPNLESKLVKIRSMDKKQLKDYFKEKSRSGPDAGSKGAGLGLIDMARKGSDFYFNFTPIDAVHTLFSLRVII